MEALGKHLRQPHRLCSSRVLIWKTCSGNGFRIKSWANPLPSSLLSPTLPNQNGAHILSQCLAKIGHLAHMYPSYTLTPLLHARCSLWRLIIKCCDTPPPYLMLFTTENHLGSWLKAKPTYLTLSPTEGRLSLILVSCCSNPNVIPMEPSVITQAWCSSMLTATTFLWHSQPLLSETCISNSYPLVLSRTHSHQASSLVVWTTISTKVAWGTH